ncbi:MAG: glycosyltransferase family 4 protein [Thermomicrobiales bacterium]
MLINHRYYPFPGGSELVVQEIAERLVGDGHDVRVVTTDAFDIEYFWDRSRRKVDAPRFDERNGVQIERVPLRHLPAGPLVFQGSRRLMGELSRLPLPAAPFEQVAIRQPRLPGLRAAIAREPSPDLILTTNIGLEGLAIVGLRVARSVGATFIMMPLVHLGRDSDPVARRYVSMPHQRRLLLRADALVAMTEFEARFLSSLGVDHARIAISGAGVTPEDVTGGNGAAFRRRHGLDSSLIVALGAVAPDKGARELVEAVARLRRNGRMVDLALAGPSLSSFERWYTGLSEDQRAGTRMLGVIDANEKRDLLDAADIVALPSRTESFGIVFVEAWANRKPVIAADAGAVPELVRDGENGLLVPFGNVGATADAIERLLDDPELASRLGANGYALANERYTWAAVYERFKQAIEIAEHRRQGRSPIERRA